MINFLSGEFFLRWKPNGGTVVFVRSVWITVAVYTTALVAKTTITPGHLWTFDPSEVRRVVSETLPWFGAIFAGSYAALYARFASQWAYLADVYNQIMSAKAQASDGSNAIFDTWEAGFIEDAEELHLALKPMFATIIRDMLTRDGVRAAYEEATPGGAKRLALIEARVIAAHAAAESRFRSIGGSEAAGATERGQDHESA